MTSELRVDNLKGSTTGGSINVLSEGTSVTTNMQQGLAKAWCNFNGTGTIATRVSFNVSGLTDNGTGSYNVNLTNAMNSASYVTTASVNYGSSGSAGSAIQPDRGNNTAILVFLETRSGTQGADVDREHNLVAVHGDLA